MDDDIYMLSAENTLQSGCMTKAVASSTHSPRNLGSRDCERHSSVGHDTCSLLDPQ